MVNNLIIKKKENEKHSLTNLKRIEKKIIEENQRQNETISMLQNQLDFYKKNYVAKCPECFWWGKMEIMPNWECERCDFRIKK